MTNPPTPYNGPAWTRRTPVDVRTWTSQLDPNLVTWLGDNLIAFDGAELTVYNADHARVTLQPSWVLVRYPDGGLIVKSPAAATREIEPEQT